MDGFTIVLIVFGFFAFVLIAFSATIWILWSRRKLVFLWFMTESGQWEKTSRKREDLGKTFKYDEETYNFSIDDCTRDSHNRPVGHWYKGNPNQMRFDHHETNKSIVIKGKEITGKDFAQLLLSKVIRDIFSDDEVINLMYILIIMTILFGVTNIIMIATHNPHVTLKADNETLSIIAQGVTNALNRGIVYG